MQTTRKLFYENAACRSFCAEVLACVPAQGGFRVALQQTAFYPEGGGQPADRGALGGTRVTDVHEDDTTGVIWHSVTTPLRVGETVQGDVDWAHRFDMMQQHTGEHILSGILYALYGCNNVGFHIGTDAVRVDVDTPLTPEQVDEAEYAANGVIQTGDAVQILWPNPQQLAAIPYRSKKPLTGMVRIVRTGAADTCACCGLHVENCSEVGLVKIVSAQHYKGGMRLAIVCGMRALQDYRAKQKQVMGVSALLSAKPDEITAAAQRMLVENGTLRAHIANLELQSFDAAACDAVKAGNTACFANALSPDGVRRFAQKLASALAENTLPCEQPGILAENAACAVFSPTADGFFYALAAVAPHADMRLTVKALNESCNGHGGGKPALAQGSVCCTKAQLQQFCTANGFAF